MRSEFSFMAALSYAIPSIFLLPLCSSHPISLEKSSNPFLIRMKGSDLIESTCKDTPNYQLCVSTLESDPRSFNTDVAGLGLVVVDALKAKAIPTVDTIKKLKMTNPEYILPLIQCSILYNVVLKADIPEAIEALTKGVPKFAEHGMIDTAVEVRECEHSFKQVHSPLTDMNKAVYDLSVVAKSIIRMLL